MGGIALTGLIFGLSVARVNMTNKRVNNKTITRPGYESVSFNTGISGHVEFTRYSDGSMDVKEFPGARWKKSVFYQDLNGDLVVDRIRKNDSAFSVDNLIEILIREYDYEGHEEDFDNADKMLRGLIRKYPLGN